MSKIKYLDFAKSVDSSRENLKDILKSKGVDVAENQSLQTYVNNVTDLPDKEQEQEYIPDPYFVAFDKYFETDPLLKKNGGIYTNVSYAVILCLYDTSFIQIDIAPSKSKQAIYTSDGQTVDIPTTGYTQKITITWDKTKDGQKTLFDIPDKIKTGQNVRWVRIYSDTYKLCIPCYESNSTEKESPLIYTLQYTEKYEALPIGGFNKSVYQLSYCKYLQYITISSDSADRYFQDGCSSCFSLEYINNLEELYANDTPRYLYSLVGTKNAIKPYKTSIGIAQHLSRPIIIDALNFEWSGWYIEKSKKIICKNDLKRFYGNGSYNYATLETIVLQNITDYLQLDADNLLTLTTAEDFSPTHISLRTPKLSKASIVQLFNNLKDLTNETARTITISSNFFVQLSDEEKEIPIKKNWTLSFNY